MRNGQQGTTLTGSQYERLTEAIVSAFPSYNVLDMMAQFRLEKGLNSIAGPNERLDVVVFRLIQEAQAGGWLARLVLGARHSQPGNPNLFAIAQELGLAANLSLQKEGRPVPATGGQFEQVIRSTNRFLPIVQFR